ncbi:hypothetical protein NOVO_00950 [Rickettsiales bacterium Ac37b]|nr:hypothetical protein NOVO_00950 [Rickettsiales bacterium Ac37b]
MSNLYHILHAMPALDREEMPPQLEEVAKSLVLSGRLRIDANDKINFARLYLPYDGVSMMFSLRELTDIKLLGHTKKIITMVLQKRHKNQGLMDKVQQEVLKLRNEIKKYQPVSEKLEMSLARLVVQSVHPVVMLMLLWERVEIFISYSYTIGDVLDVVSWQYAGDNSGMQSTDGRMATIYISAGGNPFAETTEDAVYGDGFPAMARMMIIGAQEMGHYSDIMRDAHGRQISRYSANLNATKAKENVRIGRLNDIKNLQLIRSMLIKFNVLRLAEHERHLKFFRKNKRRGITVLFTISKICFWRGCMMRKSRSKKFLGFVLFWKKEKYLASRIIAMLDDMEFNLTPKADAYSRANKVEEEAIACVEALARVPQQVVKWGANLTKIIWPNLYSIYYKEVIPGCMVAYKNMTGKDYNLKLTTPGFHPLYRLKRLFRKKIKKYSSWNY